jgi:predicted nucleic acid-binding Zn ribbon protein
MTVKYIYDCPNCGNDYTEMRAADESQFITRCTRCASADFVEVSSEVLAPEAERTSAPVVEETPSE